MLHVHVRNHLFSSLEEKEIRKLMLDERNQIVELKVEILSFRLILVSFIAINPKLNELKYHQKQVRLNFFSYVLFGILVDLTNYKQFLIECWIVLTFFSSLADFQFIHHSLLDVESFFCMLYQIFLDFYLCWLRRMLLTFQLCKENLAYLFSFSFTIAIIHVVHSPLRGCRLTAAAGLDVKN